MSRSKNASKRCSPTCSSFVRPALLGAALLLFACGRDSASSSDVRALPVFEDFTADASAAAVLREPALSPELNDHPPARGFSSSVYWTVVRPADRGMRAGPVLLDLIGSNHEWADVYEFEAPASGRARVRRTGLIFPFQSRAVENRDILFPLERPDSLYVARAYFKETADTNWALRTAANHARAVYDAQFLMGAYFGLIAVIFIYNLSIYASIQEKSYLHYLFYLATFALLLLTLEGYAYQYLWPNAPDWNQAARKVLVGLVGFAAVQFTRSFLATRSHAPVLDRALVGMIVLGGCLVVASFTTSAQTSAVFSNVYSLAMVLTILTAAGVIVARGYRPARVFLLAWSALIAGVVLTTLGLLGIVQAFWLTTNSLQIGSTLELILLTLALRERIQLLRDEKEAAESERVAARLRMLESSARFVPGPFLRFLNHESIEQVRPGDATRAEMTVLFADLRGFTSLSERMSPEESFRFINEYFKLVEPIIQSRGGFIDKFIGDAVMALFAGPPDEAVAAALEMRAAARDWTQARPDANALGVAIGLNTGRLVLGAIGTADRMDTTVIGDTVNVASRLEALTRHYGVDILLSRETVDGLARPERFLLRETDLVRMKGKERPTRVYEALGEL